MTGHFRIGQGGYRQSDDNPYTPGGYITVVYDLTGYFLFIY